MFTSRLGPNSPLGERRLAAADQLGLQHSHFVGPDSGTRVKRSGQFSSVFQGSTLTDGYYVSARLGGKTVIFGSPDCYDFVPVGYLDAALSGSGSISGIGAIVHFSGGYGLMGYDLPAASPVTEDGNGVAVDANAVYNYVTWDGTKATFLYAFLTFRLSFVNDTNVVVRTSSNVRIPAAFNGGLFEGNFASFLGYDPDNPDLIVPTIVGLTRDNVYLWPQTPYTRNKPISSDIPLYILSPTAWVQIVHYTDGHTPQNFNVTVDAGQTWQTIPKESLAGLLDDGVKALRPSETSIVFVRNHQELSDDPSALLSTIVFTNVGGVSNYKTALYLLNLRSMTLEEIFVYGERPTSPINVDLFLMRTGILHITYEANVAESRPQVYASVDYVPNLHDASHDPPEYAGPSLIVPIHTGELPIKHEWYGAGVFIDQDTFGVTAYLDGRYVIYETTNTQDQTKLGAIWSLRTIMYAGADAPVPFEPYGLTDFVNVVHLHQNDEPTYFNPGRPWLEDTLYPPPASL